MFSNSQSNNNHFQHQLMEFTDIQPKHLSQHNQSLLNILHAQKTIIQKLLENQNLLKFQIQQACRNQTTDTEHNCASTMIQGSEFSRQNEEKNTKILMNIITRLDKKASIQPLKQTSRPYQAIQIVSNYSSQPTFLTKSQNDSMSELPLKEVHSNKGCQTKNIIKNYGKSILTFIRKNRTLTEKILEQFEIDQSQFYQELQSFRCKVNSITDLKLFWTRKGNKFDKVFRILSNIYLKKHSLKHTFCSRVRNHSVHIKYRKRLMQILQDPENFNSIKYC